MTILNNKTFSASSATVCLTGSSNILASKTTDNSIIVVAAYTSPEPTIVAGRKDMYGSALNRFTGPIEIGIERIENLYIVGSHQSYSTFFHNWVHQQRTAQQLLWWKWYGNEK
ncbi:unnamed protein product [Adineta ricciae]|uniref:Uncharacterized protein n=1 Tax=Adineta ricciae TaxID=249248 RepID=A0A815I854_ADIRI|nr:unnamed protein product [Adineta ricciae]CAF1362098.1 unnamed protein product [Adineta ricciae]